MAHPCYVCNYFPVPDGEGVACPHCHRYQYGKGCPKCGQTAPTVTRGLNVFCSACGAPRGPLSGVPVGLAGSARKIGGVATYVAAVGVVVATVLFALLFGLLGSLASTTAAAIGAGVPLLLGTIAAALLFRGGAKLTASGDMSQRSAREAALYARAANNRGMLTAPEAAMVLNVTVPEADRLLTDMAKEAHRVSVEVDAQGVIHYVFKEAQPNEASPIQPARTGVRVDVAGQTMISTPPTERDEIRERVDAEFERMRSAQAMQKR